MKVYLDDERAAPAGWVDVRWPEEVIELLKTGNVTELSLDHDLGDDGHGTGYDVLLCRRAGGVQQICTANNQCPFRQSGGETTHGSGGQVDYAAHCIDI